MTNGVWTETNLRGLPKDLGYYLVKVMGYRNDYWYLVKKERLNDGGLFKGREGKDWLSLGAVGNPDGVASSISLLKSQQKAAEAAKAKAAEESTDESDNETETE